jgi:hypothetical protein
LLPLAAAALFGPSVVVQLFLAAIRLPLGQSKVVRLQVVDSYFPVKKDINPACIFGCSLVIIRKKKDSLAPFN